MFSFKRCIREHLVIVCVNIMIYDILTYMIQNQILRIPAVLLERSISGRKYSHVAIRKSSVGHLIAFQELIKLQQKDRYMVLKSVRYSYFCDRRSYRQLTDARCMPKKKGMLTALYLVHAFSIVVSAQNQTVSGCRAQRNSR